MIKDYSPINFTAYETPLHFRGKKGMYPVHDHKAIVRMADEHHYAPHEPLCIGVVGKSWKLIQNRDVFNAAEEALRSELPNDMFDRMEVVDKMSFDGAKCWREYRVLTGDRIADPKAKIGYRIVAKNGFDGATGVGMIFGLIDFYCTNGIIRGQFDDLMKKHTSRLEPSIFVQPIKKSIAEYAKSLEEVKHFSEKKLLPIDFGEFMRDVGVSERMGERLMQQFMLEREARGSTVWAAVSAMTFFSSHNSELFPVRKTANDNEAATVYQRQQMVRTWMNSDAFRRIAA